jgi:hypothetical protein
MLGGVQYDRIDDQGLHITVGGEQRLLSVDNVVICAGQDSLAELMPSEEEAANAMAALPQNRRRRAGGGTGRQARHQGRRRTGRPPVSSSRNVGDAVDGFCMLPFLARRDGVVQRRRHHS